MKLSCPEARKGFFFPYNHFYILLIYAAHKLLKAAEEIKAKLTKMRKQNLVICVSQPTKCVVAVKMKRLCVNLTNI